MQIPIDQDGAAEIALRSRGTPRIANRLLRRVRDYAQVRGSGVIDRPTANAALTMLEVDAHGFDEIDRRSAAGHHPEIRRRAGGPGTLAATLAEEQTRWKRSTSRSSSRSDFSTARRAAASPRAWPTSTSGINNGDGVRSGGAGFCAD
jgi:hypothetical protein